ncbi:MAG: glycosyltransferase family 4 protein [Methylococcaceae bacterium]|nr:glycosyltransferase family 4 protein [Methylococcaceae bacterium]MDZ4157441.1 glycosyltransferase family 4 protein [Methylococcales bacterium]MDP2393169.1 glycosyltransferase family 4 protein [Methylococcaceae bacterium]MDP3019577.1 glycosyltransferase family 4 protein [Methylococcaceae bacterium]MDP3388955.1 glycosyltransferase family 4 protein [Methylococcaceae bacterium]
MNNKPKLLYFVTEDWFFCSHFLDRAVAAQQAGFQVSVLTRVNKHGQTILDNGINLIPLALERSKINPLREISLIKSLASLYLREHPHIVHHVALKPILYGSLAAKIAGIRAIVNAPVGMGYVFSSKQLKARFLKPLVLLAYRLLLNPFNSVAVFENPDDLSYFEKLGIVKYSRLIRGAGVNTLQFGSSNEPNEVPVVLLAARMLWDKGVGEFVEAAKILQQQSISARFVLVGAPDKENPESINQSQLLEWQDAGIIEWWGQHEDMPQVFAQAHIVCLPSYREGLPKVLIEAAACGRPIVATDVPGCREIVRHNENGLLIPAKDPQALAVALNRLLNDAELRESMGKRGRAMVEAEFSTEYVVEQTLQLYKELLER